MLSKNSIYLTMLLLVTSGMVQAAIYKTMDAQGNAVYTDAPSKNAQVVNLPPLSIVPSLSPEQIALATAENQTQSQNRAPNYQLAFVQPTADQTVRKPEPVIVSVALRPTLANGDNLTLLLDGVVIANGNSAVVSTESLERGGHNLTARIANNVGKIVSEASTTFYVQQTTVNSPANQANRARTAAR